MEDPELKNKRTTVLHYLKDSNDMTNECLCVIKKKLYLIIFLRSQRILHFLLKSMWGKY